jgi:hypothetical protein
MSAFVFFKTKYRTACRLGYVGVTAHYFDKNFKLQSPMMMLKYLPKTGSGDDARHTAARICSVIEDELSTIAGKPLRQLIASATVDGASNVTAAARLLVGADKARRCVSHSLSLFMQYMLTSKPMKNVAIAISAANYMARFSKLSQHFAAQVGKIDTAVITRWYSHMHTALKVYNLRRELAAYNENNERDKSKFDEHFEVLNANNGFKVNFIHFFSK